MTEEQALKKWCPHIQIATDDDRCFDNRGGGGDNFNCIASGCMMWVEQPVYKDGEKLASIVMGGRCGLVNK